uniref:Uncharacterized protein n=1 Tax=Manihot esculenta TaxID=3983 RepID=A0A2C9WGE3_MANES
MKKEPAECLLNSVIKQPETCCMLALTSLCQLYYLLLIIAGSSASTLLSLVIFLCYNFSLFDHCLFCPLVSYYLSI